MLFGSAFRVPRPHRSEEENQQLLDLQKEHGNKWAVIAKSLTGRTENSVKNRYNSSAFKRWAAERGVALQGTCVRKKKPPAAALPGNAAAKSSAKRARATRASAEGAAEAGAEAVGAGAVAADTALGDAVASAAI